MKKLTAIALLLLATFAHGQVTTNSSVTGVFNPAQAGALANVTTLSVGASTGNNHSGSIPPFNVTATSATATTTVMGAIDYFSADANGPRFYLAKSRGATAGTMTYPVAADTLGLFEFGGASENNNRFDIGAEINVTAPSTWSATNYETNVAIKTVANASTTRLSRIDINANGIQVTGTITASAVASSGAAQSGYLCYNTTGGVITYDGGATCLVSREEYKTNLGPIKAALPTVMALRPFWGAYREGTPMADHRVQPFLGARYTASVDERLASFDKAGDPLGVRYENMTAVLVAAIQEQQTQIKRLQQEVKQLQREQYAGRQVKARQAAYIVH